MKAVVDSSKVGLTDEPATMPIERGKIREFARACMTSNPDYVTDAAPSVPPTFLTTTNFWMSAGTSPLAKLDIDLRRLLHGGQEYVFHGPPPQGRDRAHRSRRVSTRSTRKRASAAAR